MSDNVTNIDTVKVTPEDLTPEVTATDRKLEDAKKKTDSFSKFTYKFKDGFEYNGKTYAELNFDFDMLNGQDCIDIEDELAVLGKMVTAPEFNSAYQAIYAAKSCIEAIGSDALPLMPAKAFLAIKRATRNFLMIAE